MVTAFFTYVTIAFFVAVAAQVATAVATARAF